MYAIILTTAWGTIMRVQVRGLKRAIHRGAQYLADGFVSYRVRRVA